MTRKGLMRSLIYPLLRPVYYPARHYYHLLRLQTAGLNISPPSIISMGSSHEDLARRMKRAVSDRVCWTRVALDTGQVRENVELYFRRHRGVYEIEKGRGKALEHAPGTSRFHPGQALLRRGVMRQFDPEDFLSTLSEGRILGAGPNLRGGPATFFV